MKVLSVVAVFAGALALGGDAVQRTAAPAGDKSGRETDRAAIETLTAQAVAATLRRDAGALADLWTEDAIRLGPGQAAEIGKPAIRESHTRSLARPNLEILTFVPDSKDLTIWDGWAVEWAYFTGSYVASAGSAPTQVRGARLWVLKKLGDGQWKIFREMATPFAADTRPTPAPPLAPHGARDARRDADRIAIEQLKQDDVVATIARDAAAMADLWTEDAVRVSPDATAHIGRPAIREANERSTKSPLKVVSFVPETRDLVIWDGGAVEWRSFTASVAATPGGAPTSISGTLLAVLKKLPDGSWKVFRAMGFTQ